MKLLLAKLLLEFDFRMLPEKVGRYKSKSWEVAVSSQTLAKRRATFRTNYALQNYPDSENRILMKRRTHKETS